MTCLLVVSYYMHGIISPRVLFIEPGQILYETWTYKTSYLLGLPFKDARIPKQKQQFRFVCHQNN